jgi:methyl-accepting chemotaxis protein/methyl-accepting chemotaxis protein-1 (serine sensor receptor)
MLALIGIQSYLGLNTADTFRKQFDRTIDTTVRRVQLIGTISEARSEMISTQRGIVLGAVTKDRPAIEKYEQQFQEQASSLRKSLDVMRPLLTKEESRALMAELEANLSQWLPHHDELLQQARAGHAVEADRIRSEVTVPIQNKMAADTSRMQAIQSENLGEDKAGVEAQNDSSRRLEFGLLGLCLLVGAAVVVMVRRISAVLGHVAANMKESAEQVASAATQVSSASQSLAQGSSEQAASLEETSSSTAEINSMSQKNAENTKVAAELTGQVDQRVAAANQTLDQMVASMTEINASSDKVSKIIKVIDEIAFQTNILALNAAVEAARAGEAGMGFAVVADEVRNLAQRCAQAAKDTASLIEESLSKSHDGMEKLDQVTTAIRSITDSAAKVKTLVDEVQLGSQEQARGIEQISKAIAQMEQVTQKNAANAEESASASQELSAQADAMHAAAGELQAMVGGAGQDGKRTSSKSGTPRIAAAPKGGEMPQSLQALRSAVARKGAPAISSNLVAAGKPGHDALPMDEDFKDF